MLSGAFLEDVQEFLLCLGRKLRRVDLRNVHCEQATGKVLLQKVESLLNILLLGQRLVIVIVIVKVLAFVVAVEEHLEKIKLVRVDDGTTQAGPARRGLNLVCHLLQLLALSVLLIDDLELYLI